MTGLNNQQRQLLFDYSLGLVSEREAAEAEQLLSWNEEAVELHRTFQENLAPLESVELEPCPDDLTERLFARLREAAQERPDLRRLEELLAAERSGRRTIKIPLWRNWGEVVTAAAAVLLFVSVLFPSVGFMRERYAQTRCGSQLAGIHEAFRNYVADHDGLLPAVPRTAGSPWWKVGYPGPENYSNTRGPWLLVKYGYTEPKLFLCPGRREPHKITYKGFKIESLNDFPSRNYIHFSMGVGCPNSTGRDLADRGVLMADRNPLSEKLPSNLFELCRIKVGESLLTANSANHSGRGQNALLYDGSVEFTKSRQTSISQDDIYLLQGMKPGTEVRGCEFPSSENDIFLGP